VNVFTHGFYFAYHFHSMEKSSSVILLNISFCVVSHSHTGLEQHDGE